MRMLSAPNHMEGLEPRMLLTSNAAGFGSGELLRPFRAIATTANAATAIQMRFDREVFFQELQSRINPASADQRSAISTLLTFIENDPALTRDDDFMHLRWAAYMLATVRRETGRAYAPVYESDQGQGPSYFDRYEGRADLGNTQPGDGYLYRGRGYVQITGRDLYHRFSEYLHVELESDPDLAVNDAQISYDIMSYGMQNGAFTQDGKGLGYYIKPTSSDYPNARKIVNPNDKTTYQPIATDAAKFEAILRASLIDFTNVSVVEVIDRSGSMEGGKITDAKVAGRLFADLLQTGDRIGVASFAPSATTDFGLEQIVDGSDVVNRAKNAIDGLVADGGTAIRGGLEQGWEQLQRFPDDANRVMILLSDGQDDPIDTDPIGFVRSLPDDVRVFTIGLGDDVDGETLQQIAEETGGQYLFAPTSGDLSRLYAQLIAPVTGGQELLNRNLTIGPGQTTSSTVVVPHAGSTNFIATWGGSDIDLSLTAPDGTEITRDNHPTGVTYTEALTYEIIRVSDPQPGLWTIDALGVDIPEAQYPFNLTVSARDVDEDPQPPTDSTDWARIDGDALIVDGTVAADWIVVETRGGRIHVSRRARYVPNHRNWLHEPVSTKSTTEVMQLDDAISRIEVYAGDGSDRVRIGKHLPAAYILGGLGNDTLVGGDADDTLSGCAGRDRLQGGAGADLLNGGKHRDVLIGNNGADRLDGGDGNDLVNGGNGNDRIWSGGGRDVLLGKQGDDRFYCADGRVDRIDGGVGDDRAEADDRDRLRLVEHVL